MSSPQRICQTLRLRHVMLKSVGVERQRSNMLRRIAQKVYRLYFIFSKIKCMYYKSIFCSQIAKRYKCSNRFISQALKVSRQTLKSPEVPLKTLRQRVCVSISQLVMDFYVRDDNSRMSSGKKETRTKTGQKKQIRYLNFPIQYLYDKFRSEYTDIDVKRSFFYKKRPFFVLPPTLNNRELCGCALCSNTQVILFFTYNLCV
jgi:hypothetical protein